jgi:hypothetical protein
MMSLGRGQVVVFTIAAIVIFADGFTAVFADFLGIAEGSWLQACLNVYQNPEL